MTDIKTSVNQLNSEHLKSLICQIERLEKEKKALSEDISDVYGEAKGTGFDVKVLRKIIAIRKQDLSERKEQDVLLEAYMVALGMAL